MRMSFLLHEAFSGLRRNVSMTLAMILTTAISLGLFGSGLLVVKMADKTQSIFLDRVEVQLFLDNDISANDPTCVQAECATLRSDLEDTPQIVSIQYLNRDDAVRDARERVFKDQPEVAALIRPDRFPASFKIKLSDPDDFAAIGDRFAAYPGVDSVLNQKDLVDRLFSVLSGVRNAAFALAIVQGIAALLLIANMVQVAAMTRRTEVSIMRLVGATRLFTQLPFLLEAVVAALIGALIAIASLFGANRFLVRPMLGELYDANIVAQIKVADVLWVSPIVAVVGVGMAAVTAFLALRWTVRE